MSKYLLEIGLEELPYRFIPQAIEQLEQGFKKLFAEHQVDCKDVKVLATPRRLAVIIDGLSESQPDVEKIVKGPIKNIAYDEAGNLTPAGLGFCKKNGVEPSDLSVEDNYLTAKIVLKGKNTAQLLQDNVAAIVLKLQGPYFMRWAGFDEKFSRPIRWIVSLLDDKQVEVKIVDTVSSNTTRGHRFANGDLDNQEIVINHVDEYVEKLKKAFVVVDQNERKALIVDLAKKEADKLGAKTCYDEDLLDEVTYLCEWPIPVVCDFDAKYLDIPQKVTVTVMASHQRYFALYKGDKLLNKFITITNYIGSEFENIKAGNERVITARLDDAIFFFNEDTKKTLEQNLESLKGVTFQKGMGSVYDKTMRIVELSKYILSVITYGLSPETIERTALLCKADLTTSLVFEFTELQGFIGADYARFAKEDPKVALGIEEHYFPLNAESELAQGIEGQIVGIADKLDTICAVFVDGKKPTGSSDPLGVRRACLGVLKTIINKNLNLNLSELIKKTLELLPKKADVQEDIETFFIQRLLILLGETYRKDILEACSNGALEDLCDFVARVELVSNLVKTSDFGQMLECANRILRITKQENIQQVNAQLFILEAEKELFKAIENIQDDSYETLLTGLKACTKSIEKFFEDVLVMDKDEKIKLNRLALLSMLKVKYNKVADFSKILA